MSLPTKHRGAASELIASTWLLRQGYDVFRNVSPHGKIDIVAIREGEVTFVDVKTIGHTKLKDGSIVFRISKRPEIMALAGIRLLAVHPMSGECIWIDDDRGFKITER